MKATLEFNLPEDKGAFKLANESPFLALAIQEAYILIHQRLKHGEPDKAERKTLEELRETLLDAYNQTMEAE